MKKKQSPIMLVTIIVILGAIAAGWNLASSGVFKSNAPENPGLKPRQDDSASVGSSVKEALSKKGTKSETPMAKKMGVSAEGSLLEQLPQSMSKPKPNDSSTSTQWYSPDSGATKTATK